MKPSIKWTLLIGAFLIVSVNCIMDDDEDDFSGDGPGGRRLPAHKPNSNSAGSRKNENQGFFLENRGKPQPSWPESRGQDMDGFDIDDEDDELGYSGVERIDKVPDLSKPGPGGGKDLEKSGAGIIIDSDENEIMGSSEMCTDEDYCLHGGVCYIDKKRNTYCQCLENFKGDHCEIYDVIVDDGHNEPRRSTTLDWIGHPVTIAVIVFAGLLLIGLTITLLVCCCRCMRKKDEGSYTLDKAMLGGPKVEYTKVQNSQEFYA